MVRVIAKRAAKSKYDKGLTRAASSHASDPAVCSIVVDKPDAEFPVTAPADLGLFHCAVGQDGKLKAGRHRDVFVKAQPGAGGRQVTDLAWHARLITGINDQAIPVFVGAGLTAVVLGVCCGLLINSGLCVQCGDVKLPVIGARRARRVRSCGLMRP